MDYEVTRGAERLAAGYAVHVCVSPAGRPMRPAGELKALAPPAARLRGGRESQTP
jgi:acyl-CoA thioesterase FadM